MPTMITKESDLTLAVTPTAAPSSDEGAPTDEAHAACDRRRAWRDRREREEPANMNDSDFDGDDGARRRDTDPSAHDGSYGRPGDDGGRSASRGRARRRRDASIVRARWAARRIADRLHPPAGWPSGVGEAGMVTAYVAWTIGVLWWVSSLL